MSEQNRYRTLTPYITADGAGELIGFLEQAFDARTLEALKRPDGKIAHCELMIGDSLLMIADASDEFVARPASFYLYVENTDAAYERARAAGAQSLREPENTFYGDRSAGVADFAGNQWWLASRVEELSMEEIQERYEKMGE